MDNLKEKIKHYREKKNISKSELSRKIGVSPAYITKLENGDKTNPSLEILAKLSTTLDIPLDELLLEAGKKQTTFIGSIFNNNENKSPFKPISYFLDRADNPKRYLLKESFSIDTDLLTDSQIDEIINAIKFTIKLKLEEFQGDKNKIP